MDLSNHIKTIGKMYKILVPEASENKYIEASKKPYRSFEKAYASTKYGATLPNLQRKAILTLLDSIDESDLNTLMNLKTNEAQAKLFLEQCIDHIPVRITELRKKALMSQKDLAEKMNTTQQNVSRWEHGIMPGFMTWYRLAKVLGTSMEGLLIDTEAKQEQDK